MAEALPITLAINGREICANIAPRTHLADFLRNERHLTGTHLGCEQGVCGACTVLIDGRPQRSCLTFAVDCAGADVRTIEDFDRDPLMGELRAAFSAEHALQCGFCTPGMLATARDIVRRLGEVDEPRIREELAGNICRCTGYVGIVAAIRAVSIGKQPGAGLTATQPGALIPRKAAPSLEAPILHKAIAAVRAAPPAAPGTSIEERITIAASPEKVWTMLADLRGVAACLPGAEITGIDGDKVRGRVRIALGPIKPAFSGEATVTMDAASRMGKMAGRGQDSGMGSAAEGEARWQVLPGPDAESAVIVVHLTWRLSGPLAQFNRSGLVRDVVRRLAAAFAANLEASINQTAPPAASAQGISIFGLLWSVLKTRLFGQKT